MILIPSVVGLVTAIIISSFFHLHSNKNNTIIFGSKTATVIEAVITSIFVFSLAMMIWFSIAVRDLKFPRENPVRFTIETLTAGIIPALFIFILYYLRGNPINHETFFIFFMLAIKVMLIHILFQFSGVYTVFFSLKKNGSA
jgi:hypothetical protein